MAILRVLHYPDPRLRKIAVAVERVDGEIRTLVDNMFDTMYNAPGIGLAAPQVNIPKRLLVIDVSDEKNKPLTLINPQIIYQEGEELMDEGCLSVPNIYEPVKRAKKIRLQALDKDGKSYEMEAEGLLGQCIQHEVDHLQGKLFVDYLTEMKRSRIKKKMEKLRKQTL